MPIYKFENTIRLFRENKEQDVIKLLTPELNSSYRIIYKNRSCFHSRVERITMLKTFAP